MITVATTTWNCLDIIEQFLDHHLSASVDRVFVVEYGSTDGTAELLDRYAQKGLVEVHPLPNLAGKDTSNLLLDCINTATGASGWCLFIDPDEFVSDGPALVEELARVPKEIAAVTLPRYNVTGRRPEQVEHSLRAFIDLNLKIKRAKRRTSEETGQDDLDPPWIFNRVPGKVAVRIPSSLRIGTGDHTAGSASRNYRLESVQLLHFPIRSWSQFEAKVVLAERDFAANPDLLQSFGWHLRRWIRIRQRGELLAEYMKQFIAEEKLGVLLQDGTVELIGPAGASGTGALARRGMPL